MNDITKCKGLFCPVKKDCLRYSEGPILNGESYFSHPPYKNGKCEFFWGEQSQYILNEIKGIVDGNA